MIKDNLNDIIFKIQHRDMKALETLYTEMKGCIYGLAFMYTKSHSDAEDVVQNTFLHIWDKSEKYDVRNPKAWIMTIARNLSLDCIRKSSKSAELDENIHTDDCYAQIFDKDMLRTLLKTLESSEREIVLLYSYGFSHAEIAKITSIPYATVRWKYSNAIKKLIKITGGGSDE